MTLLALSAAVVMGAVHLLAGRLAFLERMPRSRWLSAAGGVSVAYVFVHILPELAAADEAVGHAVEPLERHAYLLALAGLAVFYGVERSSQRRTAEHEGAFALAVGSFAFFNALVGYLLVHRAGGAASLLLFAFAMALHFAINDVGLRDRHRDAYRRRGRWILAVAPLLGWAVGTAAEISETAVALPFAFLAGGIVLNVLKEELPAERESRFGAFALGAAGYAALLLAV